MKKNCLNCHEKGNLVEYKFCSIECCEKWEKKKKDWAETRLSWKEELSQELRGVTATEKTHPQAVHIQSLKKDALLYKKLYVEDAVRNWQNYIPNDKAGIELREYSINYFTIELSLIEKALLKTKH